MKKLFLILLTLFFVLAFSTLCLANDIGNNIKNTVNGATNSIVDGTKNLAEDVRNGIGSAENAIENGISNIGNAITDGTNTNIQNNYEAQRISADDVTTLNTSAASIWTWIAIAVAAFVIVSLVWYYAYQNNYKH